MMSHFNILDIVFIVIFGVSILLGIIKGLVRELFSLAFFIIAVILAFLFYGDLGQVFFKSVQNQDIANFSAFVSIFVVILIIGSIITYAIKKLFVIGPLKSIDRILGGCFGMLRGFLLAGILVFLLIVFPVHDRLIQDSGLCPFIMSTFDIFLEVLPDEYRQKIDVFFNNDGQKDTRTGRAI